MAPAPDAGPKSIFHIPQHTCVLIAPYEGCRNSERVCGICLMSWEQTLTVWGGTERPAYVIQDAWTPELAEKFRQIRAEWLARTFGPN